VRPILLLLLVAMIASAVWLSFGRVEARAESVEGARATHVLPMQLPPRAALQPGDDASCTRAEIALAECIDKFERAEEARVSAEDADARLREAGLPRTLDSLRARFAEAFIALRASGLSKEEALARLAGLEQDALASPTSAAR